MISTSTTSLKLGEDIKDRLRQLATSRNRSPHWIMREAITEYVEREEKRERLRRSALDVWAEYQATGLHVTAQEADAWLERLEAGEDAETPKCHM